MMIRLTTPHGRIQYGIEGLWPRDNRDGTASGQGPLRDITIEKPAASHRITRVFCMHRQQTWLETPHITDKSQSETVAGRGASSEHDRLHQKAEHGNPQGGEIGVVVSIDNRGNEENVERNGSLIIGQWRIQCPGTHYSMRTARLVHAVNLKGGHSVTEKNHATANSNVCDKYQLSCCRREGALKPCS